MQRNKEKDCAIRTIFCTFGTNQINMGQMTPGSKPDQPAGRLEKNESNIALSEELSIFDTIK